MKKIHSVDGKKSLDVSDTEYQIVQGFLHFLPDNGFMIPPDYYLTLQGKRVPLREISLEAPIPPENSALKLDNLSELR